MLESLFNKPSGLQVCSFIKKRLQHMFSCEICNIFKNNYFEEHMQMTTSILFCPRSKHQYYYKYIFFIYANHESQNKKFLWLDKTFVSYYFDSFMALKTKTGSFYALIRHLFLVILLCLWLQKPKQQVSMT